MGVGASEDGYGLALSGACLCDLARIPAQCGAVVKAAAFLRQQEPMFQFAGIYTSSVDDTV